MTKFLRKSLTAAAVAAALAAGSASAADTKPAAQAAHAAPAAAAAPAVDKAAIDAKFKGDKKAEYSYMVGMDVGRGLSSIKEDIDINVVIKALEATLKGEKTTLTEPEALAVRQDFMEKLRGEQQAKMKAGSRKEPEGRGRVPRQEQGQEGREGHRLRPAIRSGQARHRPEAGQDRQRHRELCRHQDRRHRIRQLDQARPAGQVPARERDPGLDRRPAVDAGRFGIQVLHPGQAGLWRTRPAADRPGRDAGLRRHPDQHRQAGSRPLRQRRRRTDPSSASAAKRRGKPRLFRFRGLVQCAFFQARRELRCG